MNPRRDWTAAEGKRRPCRVCGATNTQLAHTYGRKEQDEKMSGPNGGKILWVNPDSVIPLCHSYTRRIRDALYVLPGCHEKYDARKLSLLGFLAISELKDLIRKVGKERARRRLAGGVSAYNRLTGQEE